MQLQEQTIVQRHDVSCKHSVGQHRDSQDRERERARTRRHCVLGVRAVRCSVVGIVDGGSLRSHAPVYVPLTGLGRSGLNLGLDVVV